MNIKQSGNSNWLKVLVMLILAMSMTACGGLGDWTFDDLPGENYEIIRFNGENIVLAKSEKTVIERYIVAFCYDTKYIGLKRIPIDLPYTEHFSVDELDFSKLEYYLVDSQTDVTYGPCTQEEYDTYLDEFHITEMSDWLPTVKKQGDRTVGVNPNKIGDCS